MALESSRQELQLLFKPRPNPSLGREVMNAQSPRSPNRDNFGTPLWESREKEPFGCSLRAELQGEPFAGRGGQQPLQSLEKLRKYKGGSRRQEMATSPSSKMWP
jgi:hypothetical protein